MSYRIFGRLIYLFTCIFKVSLYRKLALRMKREGVMPTWRRLKRFVREHIKSSLLAPLVYSEWVKRYDTLNNDQRKDIRAHLKKTAFSASYFSHHARVQR